MLKTWLPIIIGIILMPLISQKIKDLEKRLHNETNDNNKVKIEKQIRKLNKTVVGIILIIVILTAIFTFPKG